MEDASRRGAFAGAVGLVSKGQQTILFEACGYASIFPRKVPMRRNCIFDLASVTKAIATTTAILILMERGRVSLTEKAASYLPKFAGTKGDKQTNWKKELTVEQLLNHTSGLPAWSDLYRRYGNRNEIIDGMYHDIRLESRPGSRFCYSDLGFILLGTIVEEVTTKSLDSFVDKEIFKPLGMRNTMYNPLKTGRIVSTEYSNWRTRFVSGEVHDENAFAMNGVSGHAGLFSTAKDLATFSLCLLNGGTLGKTRILSEDTVNSLSRSTTQKLGGYVGLGWWVKSRATPNIGRELSRFAFGHNGFTGTSMWIDPASNLSIILLTNRVHPVREGDPADNQSVGIMMARKHTFAEANREFQDAVISSLPR